MVVVQVASLEVETEVVMVVAGDEVVQAQMIGQKVEKCVSHTMDSGQAKVVLMSIPTTASVAMSISAATALRSPGPRRNTRLITAPQMPTHLERPLLPSQQ